MKVQFIAALIAASACVSVTPAEARRSPQGVVTTSAFDRHSVQQYTSLDVVARRAGVKHRHRGYKERPRIPRNYAVSKHERRDAKIMPHPEGCPARSFCGCGAAIKVFGKNIRELWLAANWFKFPKAEPAPGMVAVRQHHVFVILEVRGRGRVLAYDANSGGHKTRIHERRLAGYSVRNPNGSRYATAG